MDHAVALVQAYLQLNGYFTPAEYPIIAAAGRTGFRSITDIDVLAFRFPAGLPSPPSGVKNRAPRGLDISETVVPREPKRERHERRGIRSGIRRGKQG